MTKLDFFYIFLRKKGQKIDQELQNLKKMTKISKF